MMKKFGFFVCAMLGFAGCAEVVTQDVPFIDDADAVEVAFEDVATDVKIVPLISDEPIGACRRMVCYDNEVLMSDNSGEYVYYFVDGKLVSTLHAVGRGPGEYASVSHFIYSPKKKELWIDTVGDLDNILNITSMTVMKYSVPDMKYKGKMSVEGLISHLSCVDGDKILTVGSPLKISNLTEESVDTCRISLVDSESGETIRRLCDVSYYDYLQSDIMQAPGENMSVNVCVGGYINKIYHIEGNRTQMPFAFTFGVKNIPEKYFDLGQPTALALTGILEYMMSDQAKDCLEGGFFPIVDGDRYSFWYHKALSSYRDHYFRYENGDIVNYCGFRGKGMNAPVLPKTVAGKGYVAIIEGDPESVFDDTKERSQFSADLEKTMKTQYLNNPVLVYYNIK